MRGFRRPHLYFKHSHPELTVRDIAMIPHAVYRPSPNPTQPPPLESGPTGYTQIIRDGIKALNSGSDFFSVSLIFGSVLDLSFRLVFWVSFVCLFFVFSIYFLVLVFVLFIFFFSFSFCVPHVCSCSSFPHPAATPGRSHQLKTNH